MYFTAELYFDDDSEEAIRRAQRAICSQVGQVPPADIQPHITLAVCERLTAADGDNPLAGLAERLTGESILFSSFGQFTGERSVLFLAPVVTDILLAFHRKVHARLGRRLPSEEDFCAPGRWVPHCTLALGLNQRDLAIALDVAMGIPLPSIAQIADVGIKRYQPEPQ